MVEGGDWLSDQGVRTVRIPAEAILRDLGGVLAYIDAALEKTTPSTTR